MVSWRRRILPTAEVGIDLTATYRLGRFTDGSPDEVRTHSSSLAIVFSSHVPPAGTKNAVTAAPHLPSGVPAMTTWLTPGAAAMARSMSSG